MTLPKRLLLLAAVAGLAFPATASAEMVDLELGLLIDVSGSVDNGEFLLQRNGYVSAFRNPSVQTAIANSPNGVAATLVYWSSFNEQQQAVTWTLLKSAADAEAFANAIEATSRPYAGSTAIGSGIDFATPLFASNSYEGTRKVIDVSGDGADNDSFNPDLATARQNALNAGITINGLPIGDQSLQDYYATNVIGGTGSFSLGVSQFADFDSAIEKKLRAEITNTNPEVPAPAGAVLAGFAALAMMGYRRLRRRAEPTAVEAA